MHAGKTKEVIYDVRVEGFSRVYRYSTYPIVDILQNHSKRNKVCCIPFHAFQIDRRQEWS
jgi:hypothetical protein